MIPIHDLLSRIRWIPSSPKATSNSRHERKIGFRPPKVQVFQGAADDSYYQMGALRIHDLLGWTHDLEIAYFAELANA